MFENIRCHQLSIISRPRYAFCGRLCYLESFVRLSYREVVRLCCVRLDLFVAVIQLFDKILVVEGRRILEGNAVVVRDQFGHQLEFADAHILYRVYVGVFSLNVFKLSLQRKTCARVDIYVKIRLSRFRVERSFYSFADIGFSLGRAVSRNYRNVDAAVLFSKISAFDREIRNKLKRLFRSLAYEHFAVKHHLRVFVRRLDGFNLSFSVYHEIDGRIDIHAYIRFIRILVFVRTTDERGAKQYRRKHYRYYSADLFHRCFLLGISFIY